jgi:hypothetical protein
VAIPLSDHPPREATAFSVVWLATVIVAPAV